MIEGALKSDTLPTVQPDFDMQIDPALDTPLVLYLRLGTTIDIDSDCNFTVRAMTPDELKLDEQLRQLAMSTK